jgi:glycosyltransferase involved in cell wall biosynthesis
MNKNPEEYKLVIVGGPSDRVAHYDKIAVTKGLGDYICWAGPRPSDEMGAWMAISDVLVSPRSEADNTPLKLYTYMSSGSPIVATRLRTHTQVLDDSMAFLAEPDPFSLAKAISVALFNPTIARKKATKAKTIVEEKYNYKTFAEKLLFAYNSTNS